MAVGFIALLHLLFIHGAQGRAEMSHFIRVVFLHAVIIGFLDFREAGPRLYFKNFVVLQFRVAGIAPSLFQNPGCLGIAVFPRQRPAGPVPLPGF